MLGKLNLIFQNFVNVWTEGCSELKWQHETRYFANTRFFQLTLLDLIPTLPDNQTFTLDGGKVTFSLIVKVNLIALGVRLLKAF